MNESTEIHAPKLTVMVTQDIIERACRKNEHKCMIAEAVKKQLPHARQVSVDLRSIRWSDPEKGLRYVYMMPEIGTAALIGFDKGNKIPPFKFRLVNAHIRTMLTGTPKKPVRNLGKKRHVATPKEVREGATGDLIGGAKAQPRSVLIGGREYGAKLYTSLFDDPSLQETSQAEFKQHLKGYVSQQGAHPKRKKSTLSDESAAVHAQ